MREETTLYVVDSDQAARESMAEIARSKGVRVQELESGEAFLSHWSAGEGACLIVDADLPSVSGPDLQQRLNEAGQSLPIVAVGKQGDVRAAVRAMQQGAVTFLQKPCSQEELSAAIDMALDRSQQQQEARRRTEELRHRFEQLTPSEREVLSRVIDGQANRRIASEMDLGLRTVELRRSNIMRKTGAGSFSELIRLAMEIDFAFALPTPASSQTSDGGKSNGEPVAVEPQQN